jgi:hypothetical protein
VTQLRDQSLDEAEAAPHPRAAIGHDPDPTSPAGKDIPTAARS